MCATISNWTTDGKVGRRDILRVMQEFTGASSSRWEFVPGGTAGEIGGACPREGARVPLPAALAWAAERVVADLQGADPVAISLSYQASDKAPESGIVLVEVGECRYGFGVWLRESPAEKLFRLADGVQEHLCECPDAWAQARPACPGHGHPALPQLRGDAAYWVCPGDGRRLAAIGELH